MKEATLKLRYNRTTIFHRDKGETGQSHLIKASDKKVTMTRSTIRETRQTAIGMHGTAV